MSFRKLKVAKPAQFYAKSFCKLENLQPPHKMPNRAQNPFSNTHLFYYELITTTLPTTFKNTKKVQRRGI